MTEEHWLPVFGWEGLYDVSDQGRVRSLPRTAVKRNGVLQRKPGRLLKPYASTNNYSRVNLCRGGGVSPQSVRIHVLVLEAFVRPRVDGQVACHVDGDSTNNHVRNLRWGTYSENNFDLVRHGTHWQSRKMHCKNRHAFTPENTIARSDGGRACRQCGRDANSRLYAKRKRASATG